jgi:hypothetical protein
MYGIEWDQPAIVAQGLAQAAIHDDQVGSYLVKVESAATLDASKTTTTTTEPTTTSMTLPEAFERVHLDETFVKSVRQGNPNTMLDGVEIVCPHEGIPYLSQFKVDPTQMEEAVAENIHAAAYMASSSVFHPPHRPRYDFFLM